MSINQMTVRDQRIMSLVLNFKPFKWKIVRLDKTIWSKCHNALAVQAGEEHWTPRPLKYVVSL